MISHTTLAVILAMTAAYTQVTATPLMEAHQVIARQTPSPTNPPFTLDPNKVPDACRAACNPLLTVANGSCSTEACACSPAISTAFVRCVQCGFTFVGPAFFGGVAQQTYNDYVAECKASGFNVPSFTFVAPRPGVPPPAPAPAPNTRPSPVAAPAPAGNNTPAPSSSANPAPGSDDSTAAPGDSASDSGAHRGSESRIGRNGLLVAGALSAFFFFAV